MGRQGSPGAKESSTIAARLLEERRARSMSVRELGRLAGVTASLISQIENGKVNPSVGTLYRMAEALGIRVDEFFAGGRTGERGSNRGEDATGAGAGGGTSDGRGAPSGRSASAGARRGRSASEDAGKGRSASAGAGKGRSASGPDRGRSAGAGRGRGRRGAKSGAPSGGGAGQALKAGRSADAPANAVASEESRSARGPSGVDAASRPLSERLVRPDGRNRIVLAGGVRWELLTSPEEAAIDDIEVIRSTYPPDSESSSEPMHHHGREYGLVLEGELQLEVAGERVTMRPGDSITFDSMQPHRLWNTGDIDTVTIWTVHGRRGTNPDA